MYPKDYYHKSGSYRMVAQAMVESNKKFTNIFIGLPRNVNDSQVLKRSRFYQQVQYHVLFNPSKRCGDGTPPYLLRDKGYPLIN
jgi:adenylate kinase family enzyme